MRACGLEAEEGVPRTLLESASLPEPPTAHQLLLSIRLGGAFLLTLNRAGRRVEEPGGGL